MNLSEIFFSSVSYWVSSQAGSLAQVHNPVFLDLLPVGNGCDPVCVKAAPAQCLSSSDHWSPAPVVLQFDSLQSFPDLWSAVLNQLSEDPHSVLHCCLCSTLLGHKSQSAFLLHHSWATKPSCGLLNPVKVGWGRLKVTYLDCQRMAVGSNSISWSTNDQLPPLYINIIKNIRLV